MSVMKRTLGTTVAALAAVAVTAAPASANSGVAQCGYWAIEDTGVGGTVSIIPLVIAPTVSVADPTEYTNCVLDTVGLCTYEYDPVGPYSTGLGPETVTYVNCLV
ncbi:MAG TPA: hypothetical protein VNQ77_03575 [Frankiaceae bacterium]|nr:hypothetical protein [Frankiaceae bacterium]